MRIRRHRVVAGSLVLAVAAMAACSSDESTPQSRDAGVVSLDASLPDGATSGSDAGTADVAVAAETGADASVITDASADVADAADATVADAAVDAAADAGSDAAPTSGQALAFDGVDDVVDMSVDPSETAFTAELWFKMAPLGDAGFVATGNMFEVYGTGGGADRFLFLEAGKACFYVYNPSFGNPKICSTGTYNDGAWHHIAGTLGATSGVRLYVDAVEVAANAATKTSSFTTANAYRLGYGHFAFSSGFIRMTGAIDEVRVWTVERTAAQIAASYQTTMAPSTAGLQGYWKLDESVTSGVARDSALLPDGGAAGHDGVLSGFKLDAGPSPWIVPGAL